jgi:NMD protein affecting ribosome stability and mRNA decay
MKRARRNTDRRLCASCGARPALYRYHGHVKHDRTHALCFQCYRAVRDSARLAHPATFPLGKRPGQAPAGRPRGRTGTDD